MIGARTVSDDLSLLDALSSLNNRLLVDAGVLVRALELRELVDVAAHFARQLSRVVLTLDAHDNALGVNRVNHAVATRENHCAGVASSNAFHSCTNDWRLSAQQRNRLTLHVGAHQCAVGIVVLEEGN